MKIFNIKISDNDKFYNNFTKFLRLINEEILVLSFIQESRKLEDVLDVSDLIIYDNSDFLNNTIDLEDSFIEVDENIELLPSSYKMKVNNLDYKIIEDKLIKEEYNRFKYVFILFDNKLDIFNEPDYIYIFDKLDGKKETLYKDLGIISLDKSDVNIDSKIIGFLTDENDDLEILLDNLINNNFIEVKETESIIEKIKNIFRKRK